MPLLPALRARFRSDRLKRWVRRVHMFAGLVMLPWVLFFGVSGLLFNHPGIGAEVRAQPVSPAELRALGVEEAWEPQRAAARVLAALNAQGGERYALDPEFEPRLSGFTLLSAPAPDGRYVLLLDMTKAGGVLVRRTQQKRAPGTELAPTPLALPELTTAHLEARLAGLLQRHQLPQLEALKAHPKIAPELLLRARDAHGTRWNLSYDTSSGTLTGRRSDAFPQLGVAQILASMHTTHHFPLRIGALWFWALFEDLLGLIMVIWAVSGLIMWWQIKRTRLAGMLSIAAALGIAALVMGGTLSELHFGVVKEQLGPGDEP
jgi:hypothetical protein